jgi:hypothetical protein
MRRRNQIRPLPAASRAAAERQQAARADIYDMIHPSNAKCRLVVFNRPKPRGFGLSLRSMAFVLSLAREEHRGLF